MLFWGGIWRSREAVSGKERRRKGKSRLRRPIASKENSTTYAFGVVTGAGDGHDINARVCLCVYTKFRAAENGNQRARKVKKAGSTGKRYKKGQHIEKLERCTYNAGAPVDLKVFGQRQEHFRAADPHARWGPWKIRFQIQKWGRVRLSLGEPVQARDTASRYTATRSNECSTYLWQVPLGRA
jgi:hypothetical protein